MEAALTPGFQVTARDIEMLRWIGRLRFAEANQVARRFAMDEATPTAACAAWWRAS